MKSDNFQIYEWTMKSDIERHIERQQLFQPINQVYDKPIVENAVQKEYLDAHMGTYW